MWNPQTERDDSRDQLRAPNGTGHARPDIASSCQHGRRMVTVRGATKDDAVFFETMLVEALNWAPRRKSLSRDRALAIPANRKYVEGWPREGDAGVIAEDEQGRPIGAAWFCLFDPRDPGYGFVADDIPEVSIGVLPGRRGQGLGDLLLTELEDEARRRGLRGLSLSVEIANRARHLYRRQGYREVTRTGAMCTMLVDLATSVSNTVEDHRT
jgi:GNAT superfamily N-acetyltransferase